MKVQMENMTEDQMLRMAAGSKPLGQTLFMQRYKGLVRAVVSRYLDDPDDVEEVVQDAFIRIFKGIENFRGDCKLSTWISRVASSAALTRLRWKRSRIELENEDTLALERLGGYEYASGLEQREAHWWLGQALRQLNEKDHAVIERFYLKEQSIQEVCLATGWTESDVKSRLCRARQRLRAIIEERYRAVLMN